MKRPKSAARKPAALLSGLVLLCCSVVPMKAQTADVGNDPAVLAAHWRFDSVTQGVVVDAAGQGHDATFFSRDSEGPILIDGIHGKAVQLDQSREAGFTVAESEDLNVTGPVTVMAWIRPGRRNAAFSIACMKGDKSGDPPWPGWRLRYFWARAVLQLGTPDGTEPSVSSPQWSVPPGFWSHIAATWDGAVLRIYVNAVERGETPFEGAVAPQNPRRPLVLGNYIGRKNAYAFDGAIDDVRIYSACLSEDDILAAACAVPADAAEGEPINP